MADILTGTDTSQNSGILDSQSTLTGTSTDTASTATTPVSDAATVEERLTNLLEKDNPYLTRARTSAQQTSAARGLQNTSIAATAGETAAIEAALPIAQQDANYYQEKGLAEQAGEIEAGLYEKQGQISSELSAQEAQQASQLSAQEAEQQYAIQQAEIDWNKLELNAKLEIEYANMDEENKSIFNETVNSIYSEYQSDYLAILADPVYASAADRQAAINVLKESVNTRVEATAAIYNVTLDWDWQI